MALRTMTQPSELELLARVPTLGAAEALRALLAAHGIDALVVSQDALRLSPLPRPDQAGVRVLVRASDLEPARELIEAFESSGGDASEEE